MYGSKAKRKIRLTPFGYLVVAVLIAVILFFICLIAKLAGGSSLSHHETVSGSGNPLGTDEAVSSVSDVDDENNALPGLISVASAATNEPATPTPIFTPVPTPTIYIPPVVYQPGDPTPTPEPKKFCRTPSPDETLNALEGKLSTGNVNLRAGPSTNDDIIGTGFGKGTRLKVFGLENDFYFVEIIALGKCGYVSSKFVSVDGITPEPISTKVPADAVGGSISASKAMLRRGPGTEYAGIREIRRNAYLYVFFVTEGWVYVEVAGTGENGYIKADFVTTEGFVPDGTPIPD